MYEKLFTHAGLSLDRLRSFAEIVAAGGISAAAGDDPNRQSQLSRQLKELEGFFGVELLVRERGRLKLTPAGSELHRIVSHAFGALEKFGQSCANQPVELAIGAGESLIQWILLPRLVYLKKQHPKLKVTLQNLRTDEILKQLSDGRLDFGVVSRLDSKRRFATAPLGRLDYGLFVPAKLLPEKRRFRQPSEVLNDLPLAILDGSPAIREALENEARKRRLTLNINFRCSSYLQLSKVVQTMNVAAIMPTLASQSLPDGGYELLRLPILDALSRQLFLAWNKDCAEIRTAIGRYGSVLTEHFRQ